MLFVIFFGGCEHWFIDDDEFTSPTRVFQELWEGFEQRCANFESRNVDWQEIYHEFSPRVNESISDKELFDICTDMVFTLKDPHVWLKTPSWEFYTMEHLDYTKNIDINLLESSYIKKINHFSTSVFAGELNDEIGYLYIRNFYKTKDKLEILCGALENLQEKEMLIIDLRENEGGNGILASQFANHFADQKRPWLISRTKLSPGRFDSPVYWYVEPAKENRYLKPVAVLSGRYTVSAGERFVMAMSVLPNVSVIGDFTAGTQGSVTEIEMANGWKYSLTYERCTDIDGNNYDGIGVPPDTGVSVAEDDFSRGIDPVLEYAMAFLLSRFAKSE